MALLIHQNAVEASLAVAQRVKQYILAHPDTLLCLAAGDTPLAALSMLVKMQQNGEVDLSSVYYVGLDEWVGLGYETRGSCRQVMQDGFYGPAGIPADRICAFDGLADPDAQCAMVTGYIARHGGIGFTLLGIGMNGHVGFNEPNLMSTKTCLVVPLDAVTREVSKKYFDIPLPVQTGVTVSLAALSAAKTILLFATGKKKAEIISRTIGAPGDPSLPASLLTPLAQCDIYLDEAAAGAL